MIPTTMLSQELLAENLQTGDNDAVPPEIYVDQLIDEESLAAQLDAEAKASRVIAPQWSPGSMGATYRYYDNQLNDQTEFIEHGVELRWNQETQEYGFYQIQIDGLNSQGYNESQGPNGQRVQIHQKNYAINSQLQLDSDFINFRSVVPRLITESYRFRLPSTILQGMGNRIYNKDTTIFINFGEIGSYEGVAAKAYKARQGSLQGFGMHHHLNNRWDFALQLWNTQDPEVTETHQSIASALQYHQDLLAQNHQLHLLSDSTGKTGLWYDAYLKIGRWEHRAGAQYLQPDLMWTDILINNDVQSLYWRSERSSYRWFWNFGGDIAQNNLDNDPNIPGFISTAIFGNFSWRYRYKTQLGGGANLYTQTAHSGIATNDSYQYLFKAFVSHYFPFGRTRLEPRWETYDHYSEQNQRYGLLWDQDWEFKYLDRLNSSARYYTSNTQVDELNFQIYLEKYLMWDLKFNGSFQQFYEKNPNFGDTKVSSFAVGLGWQFLNNWLISLNGDYNTGNFEPNDGSDEKIKGTKVLFSINYNIDTGTRVPLYGIDTGEPGRGRIVGRVFLDENRNGYFDLDEEPLANITVYLDGRFTTETGPQGGFEFWPVASGDHYLSITMQDIPLPWSLTNEAPQRIVVPIRGQTEFRFALVRINE